jgi:uncharacterized protein (TIGR02001 family)
MVNIKSLALAGIALFGVATAQAADISVPAPVPAAAPPLFDIAFGAALATDYNFRGISQSDRGASVRGYFEARYWWLYAGVAGYSVDLATRPSGEFDITFGIRPVIGPLTLDFGATYYYYPNETQYIDAAGVVWTPRNTDFFEPYVRASYNFNDVVTIGANLFHAWDWLGTGARGTYASGTIAVNLPMNFQVSGEIGRYWLGTTDAYLGGVNLPDYTYWNAGLSYTFNNVVKLDVRYHGTDLNRGECFALTSDPRGIVGGSGTSRWCGDALVGTISFDTTLSAIRPATP